MVTETREEHSRHWFYLVPGADDELRLHTAAKLAEKAWRQSHRVCLYCDDEAQAQRMDEVLWSFRPDAFIPHCILADNGAACDEPVGIQWVAPSPADWQTTVVLGSRLPDSADRFERLALIANDNPAVLRQARNQYRQLEALGITPKVHDARKKRGR